jgi:predicted DNA-binding transcriptional regulator YafY
VEFNKGQKLVLMLDRMTRRGGVRASELMERFDLDARSLRRYLADLRDLAIPIVDDGRGDDRVVTVEARWKRTGVQLSLTEVLSLHFGRTLFNFLDGTSFQSDLDGAIERLEPAISRAHADIARQLDMRFVAVPEHAKDYRGARSEIIDEVTTAILYNNPIEARYRRLRGLSNARRLHPYTLAVFRQGLYLFALDVEAQQVKTFAIERFEDVSRRRSERFELPSGWSPRAHIAHAFGIIDGKPEDVAVAFSEEVAAYIRERTWHPTQRLGTLPDGRLRLDLRVAVTVELETWILGFGADAEVLSPAPLVEKVTTNLEGALARYRRVR